VSHAHHKSDQSWGTMGRKRARRCLGVNCNSKRRARVEFWHTLKWHLELRERHGGVGATLVAQRPHYHHLILARRGAQSRLGKNDGLVSALRIPPVERNINTTYMAMPDSDPWSPVLSRCLCVLDVHGGAKTTYIVPRHSLVTEHFA
jgi:hypothetical protein